ncbi:MAG: helix-turn-helix domain-containing protein [Candidatus ainarchaeum sp.]|nr:helix-turn-helix domain-containing protein [Candidatus ainarchaeum sp.]
MNNSNTHYLLEKLGLTEYEAKTLSTLFKLKEAQAPTISRAAQVPKTRVYDVLEKLISKGLLIEIKGRPKIYRAIEPEKTIDILIKTKKTQLNSLESEVDKFKQELVLPFEGEEKGEKIMKVKEKQDFERILGQELAKAKHNIQGLTEITDNQTIIQDALKSATEHNVKVKLLNSNPSEKLKDIIEVKQLNHGLNAFIIDDKKVILAISDFKKDKPDYHFTILNDNAPMANALTYYFNTHWDKAKKY